MFIRFYNSLIIIIIICLSFKHETFADDIPDKDFLEKYDETIKIVACEALSQTEGSTMKVNLNRYATYEEITKLAFWNYKNDFKNNQLTFDEDIKWKRDLVDIIFKIFKAACLTEFTPHEYMNIFRELSMIYLNSDSDHRTSNNTNTWEYMQTVFTSCVEDIVPYNLTARALEVTGIRGEKGGVDEVVELYPPEEKVDVVFDTTDMIVDNLWWVFSHALGQCYPKMSKPSVTAPKLRAIFIREILRPLLNRWGDPGPVQTFGPIVGNFDINRVQTNLRYCVTAAYFVNGIAEIQMVRPLKVGYVHEGINSVQNRKTGATVG